MKKNCLSSFQIEKRQLFYYKKDMGLRVNELEEEENV